MTPSELRRRAVLARSKGPLRAVTISPDEADAIADQIPQWHAVADKLPDADMVVLAALSDGDTWPAFHDDLWRYIDSTAIQSATVTHWMEFPPPPMEGDEV